MKNYFEEIVIFILQLIVFYVFPLWAVDTNSNGMIVIVLLSTFIAALAMGGISKKKLKFYYPIIISLLFIPAAYIYNTEFLVFHSLWCLISAAFGVIVGHIVMMNK